MHRTRSNVAAWMIGMAVIVAGMVTAATPSLAQTPQRAESVVNGPDQPAAGGYAASSNAEVPGKLISDLFSIPLKGQSGLARDGEFSASLPGSTPKS